MLKTEVFNSESLRKNPTVVCRVAGAEVSDFQETVRETQGFLASQTTWLIVASVLNMRSGNTGKTGNTSIKKIEFEVSVLI